MRHAPLLLGILFALPLSASLACSSKTSDTSGSPSHEGWTRYVSISGPSTERARAYALGEHARLSATDELVGPSECTEGSSSGCGSGGPSCHNPTLPTDSAVESVTCEGACVASAKPRAAGTFDIDVVAREAGPAAVVIRLRDRQGDVREARATVTFARATHISIVRAVESSPHGTTYAALPGASFTWCFGIDANGAELEYDAENLHVTVDGATFERQKGLVQGTKSGRCDSFSAIAPGELAVAATYGDLVRREKVRIVEPTDVRAVELLELGQAAGTDGALTPVELDAFRDSSASKRVDLSVDRCGTAYSFLQRLVLWDGTFALGQASSLTVTPEELFSRYDAPSDHAAVARLVPEARGHGAMVADVGAGHLEVPVEVTGRCLNAARPDDDAGTDAADAGAEDGQKEGGADEEADAAVP